MRPQSDPISRLYVDERRRDEILHVAGDRRTPAVITRYGCNGWMSVASRFGHTRSDDECIHLDVAAEELRTPDQALSIGDQVGISFRRGRSKCLFTSVITACDERHAGGSCQPAKITVRWPTNLQQMQRRLYERVSIPPGHVIEIVVWPHPGGRPGTLGKRDGLRDPVLDGAAWTQTGVMSDLSAGGVGVVMEPGRHWNTGETYVCSFRPQEEADALQFDVRLRHVDRTPDGGWSLGLQFVGLETSSAGQCQLAQLASIVTALRRRQASVAGLLGRQRRT
jgi:c-di-GMP-binding flagellar brake protein YcgR